MTDEATRDRNVALATSLMERFGRDMDGWYDNLHDDIVMEFPFGASVGMPTRVEGKQACAATFDVVCQAIQVQFSNIRISPMADPNRVLVEYRGYSEPNGTVYDQNYISVHEYRDGKLILFREYFDTVVVDRASGDPSSLGG